MQGLFNIAARLGRTWARGASVLIVTAFALGMFAVAAVFVVILGGSLVQAGNGPDDLLIAERFEWWKFSAIIWGPLAVGWALPQIGKMAAEWAAEDEAAKFEALTCSATDTQKKTGR